MSFYEKPLPRMRLVVRVPQWTMLTLILSVSRQWLFIRVQYTAGHEGAVGDLSCMSIFSACFGLLTSVHNLVRSDLDFLLNSTPF